MLRFKENWKDYSDWDNRKEIEMKKSNYTSPEFETIVLSPACDILNASGYVQYKLYDGSTDGVVEDSKLDKVIWGQ